MKFFQWVVLWLLSSCFWALASSADIEASGKCSVRASPIPLFTKNATKSSVSNIKFSCKYYNFAKGFVINDGHSVVIKLKDNKKPPYIKGVLPKEKFVFCKAYIHWPSDHTIDGKRFDTEIQLIHYREKYGSCENAANKADGLFIVARPYKKSWLPNFLISLAVAAIREASHKPNVEIKSFGLLRAILPTKDTSFFRYKDSGPAPGCEETVIWHVYADPSFYSRAQYEKITTIYDVDGKLVEANNKDLQPVNGREVEYKNQWF